MESDKKTILLFTDWYLPGYKAGGPITSCANLVEHLGDDLDFKVVCGDRDYLETEPYSDVRPGQWTKKGKADVMYLSPDRQTQEEVSSIIENVAPDVIYLNGMFSKVFTVLPLLAAKKASVRVVLAPRGMLAPAALSIRPLKKKFFLGMANLFGLFAGIKFHATNDLEADQIRSRFSGAAVRVLENIPGFAETDFSRANHKKEENKLRLYSVARIAPEKNIHFALNCLRHINRDMAVRLDLIGSVYDQGYFRRCEKICAELPKNIEVNFLGSIPQKGIVPFAEKADFFFLPTAGENYGHAIIEALLFGVPVIISDKTPWQDLRGSGLGYDLGLDTANFSNVLEEVAGWTDDRYKNEYKNIGTGAAALINLNKLHAGYLTLFDDRDRS